MKRRVSSAPAGIDSLGYDAFAYLRGGPHAVVTSTLAVLHAKRLVDAWRPGMVIGKEDVSPTLQTPMEHAVWSSLLEGIRPLTLATRPPMRRALSRSRSDLIRAGLLRPGWFWTVQRLLGIALAALAVAAVIDGWRWAEAAVAAASGLALWFVPRRTIAGQRSLVAARQRYPMPASDGVALPASAVGMAVALYGDAALLLFMSRFATEGGLFDRRAKNDELGDAPGPPVDPSSLGY